MGNIIVDSKINFNEVKERYNLSDEELGQFESSDS